MTPETTFQLLFGVIFGIAFLIVGTHRYQARQAGLQAGDTIDDRKEEGSPLFLALRIGGLLIWGSAIIYILNPAWLEWAKLPLPEILRWVGVGLGFTLMPIAYWATRAIGNNVTTTVVTRNNHELVTSGPYRYVRHPLYSIGFSLFIAFGLISSISFFLIGAVLAILLVTIRLPKEEAGLIERFGDEYVDYMNRTGRLFPKLGR